MNKIRTVIVDDHPIYRQGLRRILECQPNIAVLGEAGDGQHALQVIQRTHPDAVIIDISLPALDGLTLTKTIRTFDPHMGIVLITGFKSDETLFHSLRVGANAYLSKEDEPTFLVRALTNAVQGRYLIDDAFFDAAEVARWLTEQAPHIGYVDGDPNNDFEPLSPRELEVLCELAQGRANAEIADRLGINHQTVKNYVRRIQTKLDIPDRTQVALYAIRRGWIEQQPT